MAQTESDFDPQGMKNVHNFLMTVRHLTGHVAEMLLILIKTIVHLIIRGCVLYMTVQRNFHDFVRGQSVAETCFSHWD